MKPVRYPKDPIERSNLKRKYVEVLGKLKKADGDNKLKYMQKVWKKIRKRLPSGTCFPSDIRKILRAEYPKLIRYYERYVNIQHLINDKDIAELYEIFSYGAFHDTIAGFFMDEQNGFDLRVCHYCGMAYINKYTIKSDQVGLDIINNASIAELKKILNISTISTLNKIDKNKPYTTVKQFNSLGVFRTSDKFHSVFPEKTDKNHFDLDHVLDKGHCPITAISLMNFVPSCSVCNEKLKKNKVLGRKSPIEELSPTSKSFDFDRQVKFMLNPKPGRLINNRPTSHADDYELEMDINNPDYEIFVDMFHLRERYRFHKMEALFWLEMKCRYTNSRIQMMANSLRDTSFSFKRIKDDIFQSKLDKIERCFEKLKKDILK